MRSTDQLALPLGLLVLCLVCVPVAHRHTDAWAPQRGFLDEVEYLPTGELLDLASLGYGRVLADFLWVRATLLFGETTREDQLDIYPWLYHLCNLATDLDPRFRAVYKYGGSMLRIEGRFVDQSSLLFQKGHHHLKDEWLFPFGIAMNYHIHKGRPDIAAKWMEKAAKIGGGPSYLHNLAASMYVDSDRQTVALAFLEEEYRQLPEGPARTAVRVKLEETRYLVAKAEAEALLKAALGDGFAPSVSPALEATRAGRSLPPDPLGGEWDWLAEPGGESWSLRSTVEEAFFASIRKETGLGTSRENVE